MSGLPKDTTTSALQDASLLELASSVSCADGWNTQDLKQVLSSAQSLKSKKSAAYIKAVAKLAVLSRLCGKGQASFSEILFSLNSSCKLVRENSKYVVVELSANFRLPRIPLGYGFKGGAARIALANVIGRNTKKLSPRDFDLVRFSKGDPEQDKVIAAKIMPEDFSHGFGVEVVDSLDQYFESRDLTINEVLFFGRKVVFTKTALEDLRRGILRPTKFLSENNPEIPGKIACKILRLAAEFQVADLEFKLIDFPNNLKVAHRDFELHRKRAAELGRDIEKKYIELCAELLEIEALKKPLKSSAENKKHLKKSDNPRSKYLQIKIGLKSR